MARQDIKALLEKINSGNYTPEEERIAKYWLLKLEQQEPTDLSDEELEAISAEMWNSLETLPNVQPKTKRLWPRIAAAAAILVFISIGGYFILHNKNEQQTAQLTKNDIAPGHNQATLTLSNGQQIILTKSLNGKLAQQGSTSIQIDPASGITYSGKDNSTTQYNTLSTARGEIAPLPLVLSDGTKVWLNTASSITYPVTFAGNERKVTVTGEAYFEVVHNAAKPFTVFTSNQTIQDIGTEFDVNAYPDESNSKTTLVEGSVKVNGTILKPGQQSQLTGSKMTVSKAEIQEIIAWKSGRFRFSNEKLSEILLQASRWYNVDIVYDDPSLKNKTYGVIGNRFAKASELLHTLELTGELKFKIEDKKITVYKK